ncbi:MAG: PAS domain S-box protein [Halobacteriales archaeon]
MRPSAEAITVLHIDDDRDFVEVAAEFLEREADEISVRTATSAEAGLGELQRGDVDCIVSDYDMPGQDGIELLETVREDHPDLPFILYTGKGSEEVASEAIANGATDYLQKRSGTEQYQLLANRIVNAVEQYRSRELNADLQRIRNLIGDINQALVRAPDRETIESEVCAIISESDPYRFAWFGVHDPETGTVEVRASAGFEEGYLDTVDITTEQEPTGQGPTGRAIRRRELAVMQNIPDDPDYEPWRDAALERGYRSSAAVPIVHNDAMYGVLNVYAERAQAFDERERELLDELADDIAHALHSRERERTLHRERDRRAALFENATNAVMEVTFDDDTPVITGVNPAFEATFGYAAEDVMERPVDEVVVPEGGREEHERIKTDVQRGERVDAEVKRRTASGLRDFLLQIIPIDAGNISRGAYAWYTDITEQRARSRELERMDERIEFALAHTDSHVWVVDQHSDRTEVYGPTESLYGVEAAKVTDTEYYYDSLVHPEDRDRLRAAFESVFDGDAAHLDIEFRIQFGEKGGEVRWLHSEAHLRDEDDTIRLVGITTDITARKEREQELQRYRQLVEWMDEGAVIIDSDGRYAFVDERAAGQQSPDDWVGRPIDVFSELASVDEAAAAEHEAAIRRILAGEQEQALHTMTVSPPDGDELVVETRFKAARDADGALLGVVGISRDITERAKQERQLRRERDRLDRFASVVSHDLRNPLNVAQGRLELARADCESDHLDAADRAIKRMETLIDDMLSLAKAGEAVGATEAVELSSMVETCWGHIETGAAELVVETDATLRADRSRLQQLFENLIRNAVEHAGPQVTITVGDTASGFYLEDDGPGIPADERADVFEPGYTTAEDGTGFGLSIVRDIAQAHGWSIDVSAGETGGTRVEINGVEFAE